MFLNYLAGVVSLVLAVSSFIPWITIWFYSLKGIESIYGIVILVVGLLGVTVSIFQHLSGRMRGRAFIVFSLMALFCEGLYFRKMASFGTQINKYMELATSIFGDAVIQRIQQLLGEQWTKVLGKVIQSVGISSSIDSTDFIGGGLILATISAAVLLVVGILLEKTKPTIE